MTNTLHRKGSVEDLKGDYVIFTSVAKDIKPGSAPKIHEFLRICNKYNPINIGSSKLGSVLTDDAGYYESEGATEGAVYLVEPVAAGWEFSPVRRAVVMGVPALTPYSRAR